MPQPSPTFSATDYCREARRLRGNHKNPAVLHARLRRLHEKAAPPAPQPPEIRFESLVAGHVEFPVLRYSRRATLIRQAEQMGIGRFQANLIIAQVQYRMTLERPETTPAARTRRGWLPAVSLVLAIEGVLASAVWYVLA